MPDQKKPSNVHQLRSVAEAHIARAPVAGAPANATEELLHELELHQIELEMQNEALREAQIALEESRDRYVDLYEFAPAGYITLTDLGLIADINLSGASMLGLEREKLLQCRFARFVAADDKNHWYLHLLGVLKQEDNLGCELALLRGDGSRIHVRLDSQRLLKDGRPPTVRVVFIDISDRKRAEEEALRAGIERDVSRAGLAQILGGSSVATFVLDRDHRVAYWNRACENLTGVRAAEVLGTREQWRPFYPSERPVMADLILSGGSESRVGKHYAGKWQRSKLIEDAYEAEDFFPTFGAGGRWVFFTAAPLRDETGQRVGAIETLQDVTERKLAEVTLRESEARYRAVAQSANEAIISADSQGNIVGWNRGAEVIFGHGEAEALGMPLTQLVPPKYRERRRTEFGRWLSDSTLPASDKAIQLQGLHQNGREFPMELSLAAWETVEGRFITAIIRDTSERKLAEEQFRIAAIVFEAQEGMIITDSSGIILRVNSAFTRITGYAADEAVGQSLRLLHSGRQTADFYKAMWSSIGRSGSWQGEVWNKRKSGEIYPEWLGITAVQNDEGDVSHYVGTFTDITARKAAEDEIKHLAFYDTLTDLPNRMLLNDRLQQALVAAKRDSCGVALMFLDLDKFKPINDTYGHDVGDQLLKAAAQRILTCVRESDTVARIGGDEFIVLLRTVISSLDASSVAEKIRVALNQPFELAGHQLAISSSIGIALYPEHGSDGVELSKNADIAMYQAKKAGRDTVEIFAFSPQDDDLEEDSSGAQPLVHLHWKTTYASGNATIDHEHRILLRLANTLLEKAVTRSDAPDRFNDAFDALLTHIVEHFTHEEAILLERGYEHAAEHAKLHQALVEKALQLRRQSGESGVSIGELVDFLAYEVVARHMLVKDRDFFDLFAENMAADSEG